MTDQDIWTVDLMGTQQGDLVKTFAADDLALMLANCWDIYPEFWRSIDGWQRPNRAVYLRLLGCEVDDPAAKETGSPEIRMRQFKDRLLAFRFGSPFTGSGRSCWKFAYRTSPKTSFTIVDHGNYTMVDQASGEITLIGSGVKISVDDIVWPWPIVFPRNFNDWSDLRKLLTPEDGNPLTGLLANKKDPPARTLALQLQRQLAASCENWAKQIVAFL